MDTQSVYEKINTHIAEIKSAVEHLDQSGSEIPAVARNVARLKASVKMLELNISDVLDIP